jgi:hypothetical protein
MTDTAKYPHQSAWFKGLIIAIIMGAITFYFLGHVCQTCNPPPPLNQNWCSTYTVINPIYCGFCNAKWVSISGIFIAVWGGCVLWHSMNKSEDDPKEESQKICPCCKRKLE